jgi:thioredoxin-dependent peroxiredoxin
MTHLKIGDTAPNFEGINEKGEAVALKDFAGKKLVLYFYPKDNTPTCTVEACNLRDNYALLQAKGFEIVGVSADDSKSHQKFITKQNLPFSLLADTDLTILKAYGVWGYKKFMGKEYDGIHRFTFVIGETGVIERIFGDVKSKIHSEQILESYA